MSRPPAYLHIAAEIREKIASGAFPVGQKIPSMSQLRELYQVSSTVIRDALSELRREGLIEGQQGKGVFVRERPPEAAVPSYGTTEIHRRLDALTETVRRLDERLSQLEGASAPDSQAPSQAKRAAD